MAKNVVMLYPKNSVDLPHLLFRQLQTHFRTYESIFEYEFNFWY